MKIETKIGDDFENWGTATGSEIATASQADYTDTQGSGYSLNVGNTNVIGVKTYATDFAAATAFPDNVIHATPTKPINGIFIELPDAFTITHHASPYPTLQLMFKRSCCTTVTRCLYSCYQKNSYDNMRNKTMTRKLRSILV